MRVLKLMYEGRTASDIADALCIGRRTVEFHLAGIYRKLNVHNRVHALYRARELGLV